MTNVVNTSYDRVMKILSNGATHALFLNVQYHNKSKKYGLHRGIYTNIAKTAIASIYLQCYNPISYSGNHSG